MKQNGVVQLFILSSLDAAVQINIYYSTAKVHQHIDKWLNMMCW